MLGISELSLISASMKLHRVSKYKSVRCELNVRKPDGGVIVRRSSLAKGTAEPLWNELMSFRACADWFLVLILVVDVLSMEGINFRWIAEPIAIGTNGDLSVPFFANGKLVAELQVNMRFFPNKKAFRFLSLESMRDEKVLFVLTRKTLVEIDAMWEQSGEGVLEDEVHQCGRTKVVEGTIVSQPSDDNGIAHTNGNSNSTWGVYGDHNWGNMMRVEVPCLADALDLYSLYLTDEHALSTWLYSQAFSQPRTYLNTGLIIGRNDFPAGLSRAVDREDRALIVDTQSGDSQRYDDVNRTYYESGSRSDHSNAEQSTMHAAPMAHTAHTAHTARVIDRIDPVIGDSTDINSDFPPDPYNWLPEASELSLIRVPVAKAISVARKWLESIFSELKIAPKISPELLERQMSIFGSVLLQFPHDRHMASMRNQKSQFGWRTDDDGGGAAAGGGGGEGGGGGGGGDEHYTASREVEVLNWAQFCKFCLTAGLWTVLHTVYLIRLQLPNQQSSQLFTAGATVDDCKQSSTAVRKTTIGTILLSSSDSGGRGSGSRNRINGYISGNSNSSGRYRGDGSFAGRIDAAELCAVWRQFSRYDDELSGEVLTCDLVCLLQDMGQAYSPSELALLERRLDPDTVGSIEFTSFLDWWCA